MSFKDRVRILSKGRTFKRREVLFGIGTVMIGSPIAFVFQNCNSKLQVSQTDNSIPALPNDETSIAGIAISGRAIVGHD